MVRTKTRTPPERLPLWEHALDREALFSGNHKLARWTVDRLSRQSQLVRNMDPDDAMQEALWALYRASLSFDPALGFQWSTFAVRAMSNAVLNACASCTPAISLPRTLASGQASAACIAHAECLKHIVSLDVRGEDGGSLCDSLVAPAQADGTLSLRVRRAVRCLPRGERGAVRGMLRGMTVKCTARWLHLTPAAIKVLRKQGLERLRGMLEDLEYEWQ